MGIENFSFISYITTQMTCGLSYFYYQMYMDKHTGYINKYKSNHFIAESIG